MSPIIVMLVQQFTSSWKGYLLWTGIGFAFLNFIVFNVFILADVFRFHNWNLLFHFLVLFVISIMVRAVFLWITGTQKRYLHGR